MKKLFVLSALIASTLAQAQQFPYDTATGSAALGANTTGISNSAFGDSALLSNVSGNANAGFGASALKFNATGLGNTALGGGALYYSTGDENTAAGYAALLYLQEGSNNVALGMDAGYALYYGSNNVYIASVGEQTESGVIRIGTPGTQTAAYVLGVNVLAQLNAQAAEITLSQRQVKALQAKAK
jgi:hypothetical protein